jgi:hypothetical protein
MALSRSFDTMFVEMSNPPGTLVDGETRSDHAYFGGHR